MNSTSKKAFQYESLVDSLRSRARSNAEQTAVINLSFQAGSDNRENIIEKKLTYREYDRRAARIAAHFQKMKAMGERALLLYPSGNEYITAFYGCAYAGVIAVPAYIPHSPRLYHRLKSIVTNSQSKFILSTSEHMETIRSHLKKIDLGSLFDELIWISTDNIETDAQMDGLYEALSGQPEPVCFLQYTSGSTSDPKGVVLTHDNLLDNLAGIDDIMFRGLEIDPCIVSWLPQFHDMGLISTFLLGVYSGVPLVFMSPLDFIQRPYRWLQAITRYKGTFSPAPNFAYDLCVKTVTDPQRETLDLSSWSVAFNGAEPVRAVTLKRFATRFQDCGLTYNALNPGYGLAEATLAVSIGLRGKAPVTMDIDREALKDNLIVPVSAQDPKAMTVVGCGQRFTERTQIAIVDPHTMKRCKKGCVGEIWTKSPSVAPAYWNNPKASERTFGAYITDSLEGPFLRTGDLGFVHDNYLFITGRIKDRIIIRGKNYYPQDIERSVEESHPILRKGCNAVLLQQIDDEEHLVIVQEVNKKAKLTANEYDAVFASMRRDVAENFSLEVYEILLIKAGTIPKTSSGKIQRQHCKKMIADQNLALLARSSIDLKPAEQINLTTRDELLELDESRRQDVLVNDLRSLVASILKADPADIDSSVCLIALGVDSLGLASLSQTIENQYMIHLETPVFFESDLDLDKLTGMVLSHFSDTSTHYLPKALSRPEDANKPFPLTDLQYAYWIGRNRELSLGGVAAHAYFEFDIEDAIDLPRLSQAWNQLIRRHDMLRMVVTADGFQKILREVPIYQLDVLDLENESEADAQAKMNEIRDRLSHQVLPADQWPLFEICLSKLGPQKYRIHTSIDLLIADLFSLKILNQQWFALYRSDKAMPPPMEISFRDVVLAMETIKQTTKYEASKKYWTGRVAELPPAPQLPIVKDPGSLEQTVFKRRCIRLSKETWNMLRRRSSEYALTLSNVMLAAFSSVLTTWSKSAHFTLNLTLFNRLQIHPDVDNLVGDFTSVLLLEIDNRTPRRFFELALYLQQQMARDLEHRYYNGIEVIRDLEKVKGNSDGAKMPVVFTSAFTQETQTSGQDYFFGQSSYTISQTPQVWLDHQIYEENGELVVSWDAVEDIFPQDMLDQMFTAYEDFINQLAGDDTTWKQSVGSFTPAHMLTRQAEYNDTSAPVQADLLHSAFIRQAQAHPDRPAILTIDKQISYGELLQASGKLGYFLKDQGIQPNEQVALIMPKGWEQIVAVLGILQAGGAYLNIDPELPEERRTYLLENADVRVVITRGSTIDPAMPKGRIVFAMDEGIFADHDLQPLAPTQTPHDLAYVIYTSGSTGMPKGVMISHRGAHNTVVDIIDKFKIDSEDRIFSISSLSFDLSVFDIFGTLSVGAAMVIPPPKSERDADQIIRLLDRHQVTVWNSVPTLLELLVENLEQHNKTIPLRLAMLSGDWIPITLPERIWKVTNKAKIFSLGGATEASIWSIYYPVEKVDPAWASIPYGMPLANQTIHVLNERFESCPDWVVGDLYIGGSGLAEGYWADQVKTDKAFVTHPVTGERLYRTGDLGRFVADGYVEFLGREDFQIKIGGYRVELGEIESALNQHDLVRRAAVKKVVGKDKNAYLAAYLVLNAKGRLKRDTAAKSGDYGIEIKGDGELIVDPMDRLRFKLAQPGLRETNGAATALPAEDIDTEALYVKRGTSRRFIDAPVSMDRFGNLLNCLKQIESDGLPRYRYGSAGGLYPVQVYIQIHSDKVEGVEPGAYYYDPRQHALLALDNESTIDPGVHVAANRSVFESAAFSVFLVGKLDAITPMYGDRSRDFCLIEAGLMTQLLENAGVQNEIGFCQIGGFQDASFVNRLYRLDENQILLHALVGGSADYADPARSVPPTAQTAESDSQTLIEEIRTHCLEKLPPYMLPKQWITLDQMPLSGVGKVDYKALPNPLTQNAPVGQTCTQPRNELERTIARILAKKLDLEEIDIYTNFFDMGADSMTITRAYRVLAQETGLEFPVIRMFEYPSVVALSSYLSETKKDETDYGAIEAKVNRQKKAMERRRAVKRKRIAEYAQ